MAPVKLIYTPLPKTEVKLWLPKKQILGKQQEREESNFKKGESIMEVHDQIVCCITVLPCALSDSIIDPSFLFFFSLPTCKYTFMLSQSLAPFCMVYAGLWRDHTWLPFNSSHQKPALFTFMLLISQIVNWVYNKDTANWDNIETNAVCFDFRKAWRFLLKS